MTIITNLTVESIVFNALIYIVIGMLWYLFMLKTNFNQGRFEWRDASYIVPLWLFWVVFGFFYVLYLNLFKQ